MYAIRFVHSRFVAVTDSSETLMEMMMITLNDCRRIEEIDMRGPGSCQWPDEQVTRRARQWEQWVAPLLTGQSVDIGEDMGSCQCGDIDARLWLTPEGVLWCRTQGRHQWQCYDGPASRCQVSYRVGVRARQYAAALEACTACV